MWKAILSLLSKIFGWFTARETTKQIETVIEVTEKLEEALKPKRVRIKPKWRKRRFRIFKDN